MSGAYALLCHWDAGRGERARSLRSGVRRAWLVELEQAVRAYCLIRLGPLLRAATTLDTTRSLGLSADALVAIGR